MNRKFEAQSIVAAAAILTKPPYREANACLVEPVFTEAEKGYEAVVHEAELCKELLKTERADVIHLDMSLGAVPVEQLSPIQFSNIRMSRKGKRHLLRILPKLRKTAGEISRTYKIEVLAIGKESIPVRIAELTAGAHASLYACRQALKNNREILLGLPLKCLPRFSGKILSLHSLIAAEHDIKGQAEDSNGILGRVDIVEMLNPRARGFRVLRISPRD